MRFKIITFGCRVNQAESRQIGEKLCEKLKAGQTEDIKKANLIIINSCTVTQKASKEIRQEIRKIKRINPNCFLVVTGCWATHLRQAYGGQAETANLIDLLVTNKDKKNLVKILLNKNLFKPGKTQKEIFYQDKYAKCQKAIVKIQDGCDNFCRYCIVPYLRGRSVSKPVKDVIKEIKKLQKSGIKEIVLTGIDIEDYRDKNIKIPQLLGQILTKTTIAKISFGSIGWQMLDKYFFALYKDPKFDSRLTSHFHIPLQSGCDATLERMGRKYKTGECFKKLKEINDEIPDFSFSTDLIVGFPGETDNEFKETREFIKKIRTYLGARFLKIHLFRYSSRPGTMAARMEGRRGWEKVAKLEQKKRAIALPHFLWDR